MVLVLVLALPALAAGQAIPPDPDEPQVAAELARLNATLREIADLLAQQVETAGLDLLLRRADLANQEVARLEGQLRSAEASRAGIADERARVEEMLEGFAAQADSGAGDEEAMQFHARRVAGELERLQGRLRDLDREIAELQSRLASRRQEVEDWQDLLDRRLGGR